MLIYKVSPPRQSLFVQFEFGLGANPATVMAVLDEFRHNFNQIERNV